MVCLVTRVCCPDPKGIHTKTSTDVDGRLAIESVAKSVNIYKTKVSTPRDISYEPVTDGVEATIALKGVDSVDPVSANKVEIDDTATM